MGNLAITIFILYSMILANVNANVIAKPGSCKEPESGIEEWFENLAQAKEIKTKLHFYLQDVVSGDNRTIWTVAQSEITSTSPSGFGKVIMIDDLLTSGPDFDSETVGRAQGIVAFADLNESALYESVNIVFTHGKYKGSTISILGRNPLFNEVRELPILGGTGFFRMARGIVVTKTHIDDPVISVYEYTMYVYDPTNSNPFMFYSPKSNKFQPVYVLFTQIQQIPSPPLVRDPKIVS